jgi:hypothetical protein
MGSVQQIGHHSSASGSFGPGCEEPAALGGEAAAGGGAELLMAFFLHSL